MRELSGGVRVLVEGDGESIREGTRSYRLLITSRTGAQHLAHSVSEYSQGRSLVRVNPVGEEVLYVVSGRGACTIGACDYELEPDAGVFIPPRAEYSVENRSEQKLVIVSVMSPEDDLSHVVTRPVQEPRPGRKLPWRVVREQERPIEDMGNREFRVLVNQEMGCQNVTQFVGLIPPGTDEVHAHPYELAIYILDGSGIVHTETDSSQFFRGTSIHIPAGVSHYLENPLHTAVRLLGVFHPSGSPAARYHRR